MNEINGPDNLSNTQTADAQNLIIDDRYQILEVIGQGGMGTVLKARHTRLSKFVAIKVLNANLLVDETNRQRFEIEAQAGSKLSHPHLVSVFDYGFTRAAEPYLVMEYIEGMSLDHMLSEKGKLSIRVLLEIFIQVAKAIQYIHDNHIVHRDLKTSNIMVQTIGSERYAKVLDFGISKVFSDCGDTIQHLTATGTILGSPLYMSPEHCRGEKTDARSDIYSLGCVMFECFTGYPPFRGDNPLQTLYKHITDEPPMIEYSNLSEYNLGLVMQKCMNKKPTDRFQSAQELLEALNAVAASLQQTNVGLAQPGFIFTNDTMKSSGRQSTTKPTTVDVPPPASADTGYGQQHPKTQDWSKLDAKTVAGLITVILIILAKLPDIALVFSSFQHTMQLKEQTDRSFNNTQKLLEQYNDRMEQRIQK